MDDMLTENSESTTCKRGHTGIEPTFQLSRNKSS